MKNCRFLFLISFILWLSCNDNKQSPSITSIKNIDTSSPQINLQTEQDGKTDRTIWQKPYIIIELLGDLSNQVIADIGAGSGYFSFRFVHKAKTVIAVDIEKELVDMMIAEKSYYKQEIQNKFEARLAQADNPNLEDNEIDIAFIANTYPYISNRIQYLKKLRSKFKANGKIMIVDFKKKLTPIGPSQEERLAQSEVEQELIDAGYQLIISDDTTLQYQYIIVAKI